MTVSSPIEHSLGHPDGPSRYHRNDPGKGMDSWDPVESWKHWDRAQPREQRGTLEHMDRWQEFRRDLRARRDKMGL